MTPTAAFPALLLILASCGGSEATPGDSSSTPVASAAQSARAASNDGGERFEMTSKPFEVEEIYRSMRGPRQGRNVALDEAAGDELVWITGFHADMVAGDDDTPMSDEFMCHTNFDFRTNKAGKGLAEKVNLPRTLVSPRLFTLSQGQLDVEFPPGFGLPARASESFFVQMQVLNLNHEGGGFSVRHHLSVDYQRHDPATPMQPLFVTTAYALVSLGGESAVWGYEQGNVPEEHDDASCLPGHIATRDTMMMDDAGNKFSGHFIVPPGRHTYRTLVTELMAVPYDTTVHFIAVHVHPYSESVALRDLTTGETVYEAKSFSFTDKIGLQHVESYSSVDGLPIFADHAYEIVSVYDNTSGAEQDSMAVLLLYALDKRFQQRFKG